MDNNRTIGFIGLGNAGWPMAGQLVDAGYRLVVHDQESDRATRFAAEHDATAADGAEAFSGADVIFTMLPHGGIVREALLGSGALADGLTPGTIVVDTSSSAPQDTRALAADLAGRGITLVDAAVSEDEVGGGKRGAITFMVGADDAETLERVRPLLEIMSTHLFHLGPVGAGHAMKTLNNYVSSAGLHAALDALMIGHRCGLDPAKLLDVLNLSTGRNFSTQETLKYKALPRQFERRYALGHLVKDLGIAGRLAAETGFETDLVELLERDFGAARDEIGRDEDLTTSLLHWEHRAGVELPASTG